MILLLRRIPQVLVCCLVAATLASCGNEKRLSRPGPLLACGDGVRTGGEACDDGNANNDDACSNVCTINGPNGSVFNPSNPLYVHLQTSQVLEPTDDASFRVKCGVSHVNYDDPIVYPEMPGHAHLHMYMGNTDIDAYITPENIGSSSGSTCQGGPLNLSGYWVPALLRPDGSGGYAVVYPEDTYVLDENGVPVVGEDGAPLSNNNNGPDIYYKRSAATGDQVLQPFPRGLRMIAGTASATPENPADTGALWSCHEEHSANPDSMDQWELHIPTCHPNPDPAGAPYHLLLRIGFPQCWDGVNLDSPDHKSHMSRPVYPEGGEPECPASHPVWMPEVSYQLYYPVTAENVGATGDTSDWFMASDSYEAGPGSPGGHSAHGDWYMSWNEEIMAAFVRYCINEHRHCANGEIGNGFTLSGTIPGRGNSEGLAVINRGRGEHGAH